VEEAVTKSHDREAVTKAMIQRGWRWEEKVWRGLAEVQLSKHSEEGVLCIMYREYAYSVHSVHSVHRLHNVHSVQSSGVCQMVHSHQSNLGLVDRHGSPLRLTVHSGGWNTSLSPHRGRPWNFISPRTRYPLPPPSPSLWTFLC
jgi:hypothetical protein